MKIRIGNDIVIRMRLTRNGENENVAGKKLSVMLRSAYKKIIAEHTVIDDEIIVSWLGSEQEMTGTYTVTVIEEYGNGNRNTVDACNAFTLVSRSCDETDAKTGSQTIDLNLDISVPSNGLSAYEIAVLHGFKGTEEEWVALITGSGHNVVDIYDDNAMSLILPAGHPAWLGNTLNLPDVIGMVVKGNREDRADLKIADLYFGNEAIALARIRVPYKNSQYEKKEDYPIINFEAFDLSEYQTVYGVRKLLGPYGNTAYYPHVFITMNQQYEYKYAIGFGAGMMNSKNSGNLSDYKKSTVYLIPDSLSGAGVGGGLPTWSSTFQYSGKSNSDVLLGGGGTITVDEISEKTKEYIKERQYTIPHPKYIVGKNSDSEFLIDVSEYDGFDDANGEKRLYFYYGERAVTINPDGTYKLNSIYRYNWTSDEFYKRNREHRYYVESKYIPFGFIDAPNTQNSSILSFYRLLSTREAIEVGRQDGEYVQSYFYYRDNSNGYFKDKWWSIYAGTPIKNAVIDIAKFRTSEYIPHIKNMPEDISRVNIFAMCRELETVILYSSNPDVTEIEECFTKSMFQGCKKLKKVVFRGVKPKNSAFLFDRIDNNSSYAEKGTKNETALEILSDMPISFGKGIFQLFPFGEIVGLNGFSIDGSVTDLSYCFYNAHLCKNILLPSCFLKPNNVENYNNFIKTLNYGVEKINVISEDGTIKNQEYGVYIPIIPSENVNSIQLDNLVYLKGNVAHPMKVEFIGSNVGDKVIKITSARYILPSSSVKKEIYADEHFEFTNCSYMLMGRDICAYFKTSLTANMSVVFLDLRKFKCIPEFFNTKNTIDFSRGINTGVEGYFGFNDDNSTSNGSLEHVAETAPTIADGNKRILKFASYLKNAEWAAPYIAQLQEKGYTIA